MLDMMCVHCGNYLVNKTTHRFNVRCITPLSCVDAVKKLKELTEENEELKVLNNNLIKANKIKDISEYTSEEIDNRINNIAATIHEAFGKKEKSNDTNTK